MSNDSKPNGKSEIIKDLCVSIIDGHAPLTVGFFLDGPTIAHRKRWHFGDGKIDRNNNLLCTHTYWDRGDYEVWVDIIDDNDRVIDSSKRIREIRINVRDITTEITSFDQWQGVIYQGDSVGFSISHKIRGTPKITWKWGDETPDTFVKPNPHHKYEKAGKWEGTVTISGNGITDSREFAVMVLLNRVKNMTGWFDVTISLQVDSSSDMPFPPKKELIFTANPVGGTPPYDYTWDFGDKSTKKFHLPQVKHQYDKSDNYPVKCIITDESGFRIIMSKDVIIESINQN